MENASDNLDRLLICLSGLSDMAAEITTNPQLKASLKTVLRMIKGSFAISKGAIFHVQHESRRLTLLTAIGLDEKPTVLSVPQPTEAYWSTYDSPITAEDIEGLPAIRNFAIANETPLSALPRTLWIPLVMKGKVLGLLMLSEKLGGHPYSEIERDLLSVMGRQIAVALYNHSLNFKLDLKVVELERLHEITSIIHSTLNRTTIIRELVSHAVSLLNARRGVLLTFDEARGELELEASFNFNYWPQGTAFPLQDLWLEGVVLANRGEIFDNPLVIPAEFDSFTCVAVPISSRDQVVGVLAVFDKEAGLGIGAFTEGDMQLLSALAVQAAASIENARLYEMATVDGLTKLYIRRHFEQRFIEEIRRTQRYGTHLSLMMIDIDHFKRFNDSYGHACGDEALRLVAGVIKRSVREDLDIAARYGGEEMMVLMPETDSEGARILAERVRMAIEETPLPGPNGETLQVTVSIGVSTMPQHATTDDALMEVADQALYASKHAGRNRVTVHTPAPEIVTP
ncbi:Phytochrome-like protein cph2 [compost metagenome]